MDNELQDRAWALLPKEFRNEVRELYFKWSFKPNEPFSSRPVLDLMERLFGRDNATSDTEYDTPNLSNPSKIGNFCVGDKVRIKNGDAKGEVATIVYISEKDAMCRVEFARKAQEGESWYSEYDIEPYRKEPEAMRKEKQGILLSDEEEFSRRRRELDEHAKIIKTNRDISDIYIDAYKKIHEILKNYELFKIED